MGEILQSPPVLDIDMNTYHSEIFFLDLFPFDGLRSIFHSNWCTLKFCTISSITGDRTTTIHPPVQWPPCCWETRPKQVTMVVPRVSCFIHIKLDLFPNFLPIKIAARRLQSNSVGFHYKEPLPNHPDVGWTCPMPLR